MHPLNIFVFFAFQSALSFKFINPSSVNRLKLKKCSHLFAGGLAEKLGSIVQFISGQNKITEANIEDTLKAISFCIL